MPEPIETTTVVPPSKPLLLVPATADAVATDQAALATAIAQTVINTPGVTRLEPTLSTGNLKTLLKGGPSDGVRLVLRNAMADVDVNVATTRDHQARAVAHQIRDDVQAVLAAHQAATGSIVISVLTID